MPRLNLWRLLEILRSMDRELRDIWVECKNYDLCDRIAHQRDILTSLIESISLLVED